MHPSSSAPRHPKVLSGFLGTPASWSAPSWGKRSIEESKYLSPETSLLKETLWSSSHMAPFSCNPVVRNEGGASEEAGMKGLRFASRPLCNHPAILSPHWHR